jgi:hypothetical protein
MTSHDVASTVHQSFANGMGAAAVRRVNTKVIFAKPSEESKKLLDVWQRAEPAYAGAGAYAGPLLSST